jgi:hypothetical protein
MPLLRGGIQDEVILFIVFQKGTFYPKSQTKFGCSPSKPRQAFQSKICL